MPSVSSAIAALPPLWPVVDTAHARLARLLHDRRFGHWVGAALGTAAAPSARIAPASPGAYRETAVLNLVCDAGQFTLAADAAAWPMLDMAAQLAGHSPDRANETLARDVAEALLAPLIEPLARALPGLHVAEVRRAAGDAAMAFELRLGAHSVGLLSVDDGVARCVTDALYTGRRLGMAHLRHLRLPGRCRLFVRQLSVTDLRSLAPGDIVIAGAACARGAPLRAQLSFGTGTTMLAAADVDIDASTATLTEPFVMAPDDPDADTPGLGELGDLTVPVAFEIDSARISLDELAALGEGSVLELDVPVLEATVQLVCCGQVVGLGQLVAIGDRLGVRIQRMGLKASALQGN